MIQRSNDDYIFHKIRVINGLVAIEEMSYSMIKEMFKFVSNGSLQSDEGSAESELPLFQI